MATARRLCPPWRSRSGFGLSESMARRLVARLFGYGYFRGDVPTGHGDALWKVDSLNPDGADVAAALHVDVDDGGAAGRDVDVGRGDCRLQIKRRAIGGQTVRVVLAPALGEIFDGYGRCDARPSGTLN